MKYVRFYLKENVARIILTSIIIVISLIIMNLYRIPFENIMYIMEVDITIIIIYVAYEFYIFCRKIKILEKYICVDEIYEMNDLKADSYIEEEYLKILKRLLKQKAEIITDKEKSMKEMQDYYAVWAHQIKTPIAASNLLIQTMESENIDIKELKIEMFKIEFYVDAVMNFLKLEDITSDYVFKKYNISTMVNKSVKRFATQFINKKISLIIDSIDREIYTDEKWYCYIVEQILSNSVKYTGKNGHVKIYIEGEHNLVIEDNGIGISEEDIPRIMEKGFTGFNGRMNKKSTGIGLYLCNSAAGKLGIKIHIDSEVGKGTKVVLMLNQEHKIHE